MVWSTLPDGYHDYYNAKWYEFTGVSRGSTDGDEWNGMFHPDDQERAWTVWRRSLATGEPYHMEYRLRRHDGAYRWIREIFVARFAADGAFLAVRVPAGDPRLVCRYLPPGFREGLAVSTVTAALAAISACRRNPGGRRRSTGASSCRPRRCGGSASTISMRTS